MEWKSRLKGALNALRGRLPSEPQLILPIQAPEPTVVMDNKLLSGKTVLVTGAGRNIGRSIAIEMAKQGANIFFTDLEQNRCWDLEQILGKFPITAKGFVSDISSTEDIDKLCDSLTQNEIQIDVLVNNTGIQLNGESIQTFDLVMSRQILNTNVLGPLYLTHQIVQSFKQNHVNGSILFITSIHQDTISRMASYSASKAALGMLIKELALELAPYGIRVNGIAPGAVREDELANPFHFRHAPLHQSTINPCYIGRAAVYLTSDYFSKFTTGAVLKIDAGLSLHSYMSL